MELEELPSSIPLSIAHKLGMFVTMDQGGSHPWDTVTEFDAVVIGGVKQRIMWPPYGAAGDRRPLCKSNNNREGYPQVNFPWNDARSIYEGDAPIEGHEHDTLKCTDCQFKLNPRHYKDMALPVCESSYKLILLDPQDRVVIFNAQGAAKRVVAHYAKWFQQNNQPMFTHITRFELTSVKNNGNRYADLELRKGGPTDKSRWVSRYLPLFKQWREELETPPSSGTAATSKPELTTLDM